jgi:hypothetical protein
MLTYAQREREREYVCARANHNLLWFIGNPGPEERALWKATWPALVILMPGVWTTKHQGGSREAACTTTSPENQHPPLPALDSPRNSLQF